MTVMAAPLPAAGRLSKTARRNCRRKRAYLSRMLAENTADLLALAHPDWAPLTAYVCPVCCDWHLTTSRPRAAP